MSNVITRDQLVPKPIAELVSMYNTMAPKPRAGFKTKSEAVEAIISLQSEQSRKTDAISPKPEVEVKTTKTPRPPKECKQSAMGTLRAHFESHSSATLSELTALIGKSDAWVQCAMAIFRNPERAGKLGPIATVYDRKAKTFTIQA